MPRAWRRANAGMRRARRAGAAGAATKVARATKIAPTERTFKSAEAAEAANVGDVAIEAGPTRVTETTAQDTDALGHEGSAVQPSLTPKPGTGAPTANAAPTAPSVSEAATTIQASAVPDDGAPSGSAGCITSRPDAG